MWDFDDAQRKILEVGSSLKMPGTERVGVLAAARRVLAEEVVSPIDLPAHDYSAMDGYAVNTSDFSSEGEVTLPVSGECRTGHPSVAVTPGHCVRIFTGAGIPRGADAVVIQENVRAVGTAATFLQPPSAGDHIRRAGEDLQRGSVVLSPGTRLSPMHLSLLASVERTEVLVRARPRVTILCTGDELRAPGAIESPGSLAESNSVGIAAAIEAVGGVALRGPLVSDELEPMKQALLAATRSSDVIVTVGGVSVGDHDLVAPALGALGALVYFHKVRIKPGKPILFARLGETLILGLPGNPSSAQVTFALFGVPLLRSLSGDAASRLPERTAQLAQDFEQKPGRRGFYRARITGDRVELYSNQASGATTSMAWSNALAVIFEDQEKVAAGSRVPVLTYDEIFS